MNDPGTDQPIQQADQEMEANPYEKQEALEEEEERDFLDPSRWWFASTAAPLIAGTVGPMANAFSICALAQYWREYIPPGGSASTGNSIKDPTWLTAVNAVSLVMALIANLALLLNMARRLSFAIAQSITIIGWLMSSLLLIGLVAAANTNSFRIQPPESHALTQAYYYAIIAAALYFIVALLMVLTVVGAWRGHYEKEFRLTLVQRTLMLQTIAFMFYLVLGACIYSYIENWTFLDAVFWADFTLLTVGIGDNFTPATHLGRSLLFPYAVGGIVTVGLVIGSIRSLILERGKQKMTARMVEKRRERVIGSADMNKRTIKVGTFQKIRFSQKHLTEAQRREQEFHIMRKIQADAAASRKWMALGFSTMAAMTLWLVGAAVFRASEQPQEWTYFDALYFSYTSLLTIGYGDLTPTSNSGKPFFVVWSLLAVPTLTVLISDMGDTVVKLISDLTNWAGTLTILPGENGIKTGWRGAIENIKNNQLHRKKEFHTGVPGRGIPGADGTDDAEASGNKERTLQDLTMDRLSRYLEEEELKEAGKAGRKGDDIERDRHLYLYILARETRKLMKDVQASPPKEYSYSDWAWYLKLIGQDESNPDHHRGPPVHAPHDKEEEGEKHENIGEAGGQDGRLKWSWLGTRSPLMGNSSEAEWLLGRLSVTLERELRRLHTGNKGRQERPPISYNDIIAKKEEEKVEEPEKSQEVESEEKKLEETGPSESSDNSKVSESSYDKTDDSVSDDSGGEVKEKQIEQEVAS